MRNEQRLGRPYDISFQAESLCSHVSLELAPGLILENSSERIRLPEQLEIESRIKIDMGLTIADFLTGIASQSLAPEDVELVVVSQVDLLRKSFVLARISVPKDVSDEANLDFDVDLPVWIRDAMQSTVTRLGFRVYLVLRNSTTKNGIRPYMAGTWLSCAKFTFGRNEPHGHGFTVEILSDEHYDLGVSRQAEWLVDITGSLIAEPLEAIVFKIFLNAEFLTRLQHCADPAIRAAMNRGLEYIALDTLIRTLERELSEIESVADLSGSAAMTILDNLGKITKQKTEMVFDSLRSNDVDILLSKIQGSVGVLASGLDLLAMENDGDQGE
jgi:hypothetical protein